MGLLDGFEKLINEHGSAAILKERIALANDQYTALEKKSKESESRVTELESENKTLHLELEKAKAEIESLKGDVEKPDGDSLEKIKEDILVILADHDAYERDIVQSLGVGIQVATFHLEELEEKNFIGRSLSLIGEEFPWYLNQEGRRYLINHDLIT